MKALILAGGRGKRLEDLTNQSNKCMIKVLDKPAIEYSLDIAASIDVNEIVIVVGYRAEDIINKYGNHYRNKPLKYVIQWEQNGLVHAIECAREILNGEDFLLMLGDEIMVNPRHKEMLDEYIKNKNIFVLCGVLLAEDKNQIKRTYTLIQDSSNVIYRLVEKPRTPINDFMGTGDCIFRNGIFDYISVTPVHHKRNEKELPDLIQCAIDDGNLIKSFNVCDAYANINSKDDVIYAETMLKR